MAAIACAGVAAWTLFEYAIHRISLYGIRRSSDWHAEHHRRPSALIGASTPVSAELIAGFVLLPALLWAGPLRAGAPDAGPPDQLPRVLDLLDDASRSASLAPLERLDPRLQAWACAASPACQARRPPRRHDGLLGPRLLHIVQSRAVQAPRFDISQRSGRDGREARLPRRLAQARDGRELTPAGAAGPKREGSSAVLEAVTSHQVDARKRADFATVRLALTSDPFTAEIDVLDGRIGAHPVHRLCTRRRGTEAEQERKGEHDRSDFIRWAYG